MLVVLCWVRLLHYDLVSLVLAERAVSFILPWCPHHHIAGSLNWGEPRIRCQHVELDCFNLVLVVKCWLVVLRRILIIDVAHSFQEPSTLVTENLSKSLVRLFARYWNSDATKHVKSVFPPPRSRSFLREHLLPLLHFFEDILVQISLAQIKSNILLS